MSLTIHKTAPSKLCLLHHMIKGQVVDGFSRAKRKLQRQELNYIAKHEYAVPDSPACMQAIELVRACSPDFLLNHGFRSYAFGVAMSHKVNKKYDKEVLFLGSIMHDLGLTEQHDHGGTFECDGAKSAYNFAIEQGLEIPRAELIHEMVALHDSIGVAETKEPEIALIHYGAGLDVAALWHQDIHPETLHDIVRAYPRLDFAEAFIALLQDQIARKPHNYMKTLIDLGFYDKMLAVNF
ncbi:hypothetical protein L9G15_18580 [Shewanella sp. A3A]|uniref:HD domain-containing protein n=1 Tax=Shewanella electrica TaxID=515560 RepID=A0ABT2FKC8_9GAMM|nr:hypothetical protein [Shewanella electrica]MCH1921434.1 hypothetical protein [Shewanella ferrihydritica]MCH1924222.1 hypothetical protein [Shewanella electrica]MCS4556125.1 hypothetical protein [Shewanella electrica]